MRRRTRDGNWGGFCWRGRMWCLLRKRKYNVLYGISCRSFAGIWEPLLDECQFGIFWQSIARQEGWRKRITRVNEIILSLPIQLSSNYLSCFHRVSLVMSAGGVRSRFWDVFDSIGRWCRHIVTRPISDRSSYSGVVTRPIFGSVGLQC